MEPVGYSGTGYTGAGYEDMRFACQGGRFGGHCGGIRG